MRRIIILASAFVSLILLVPLFIVSIAPPLGFDSAGAQTLPIAAQTEPMSVISTYIASQDIVVDMDFGEYLKGVVAGEMPASFNDEALKAQAVAARSYILVRAKGYEKNGIPDEHKGALACTDPNHCKAWLSQQDIIDRWGEDWMTNYWGKISASVTSTTGVIMTYNGEPVNAVFHSTGSGHTENSKDVWGGDVPYLVGVESVGDISSPKFASQSIISIADFKSKVIALYPDAVWQDGTPVISDTVRSDAGGLISVSTGGITIKGTLFRTMLELRSTNVTFTEQDGNLIMDVKGTGHGVGMSQYGANYLAGQGMGYADILKTYYTGVEVGLYQDIQY